jgi:hypothetical protein
MGAGEMSSTYIDAICVECGGPYRRRKVEKTKSPNRCRPCAQNAAEVDWLAIENVILGFSAPLNSAEKRLVVRRLAHRLMSITDNRSLVPPGMITQAQLGKRMGVTSDAVTQILRRLPPATRRRCPDCRSAMWVFDASGVVEEHSNGFLDRCRMSGELWRVSA